MRAASAGILAICLCCALGCGGAADLAEVSGTVKLDGDFIEEGAIQFIPIDGTTGPSAGSDIKDGKYHIARAKGVVVGKNRVELRAFRKSGKMVADATGPAGAKTEERIQVFPPEYNVESKEVREVKSGSNTIDFDVKVKTK